ncbi:MAG: alpha-2-macroglobulin family protein, partial [Thermodesulfobacteriota bacterium]
MPDGYKGYVFTNEDRKFKSRQIFKQEGNLDQDGTSSFTSDIPDGLRPPSSLQAQITARVQEAGGRGVTSKRMVNVDPYPYYLGIKEVEPNKYAEPGIEVGFEFVALSEKDGKTIEVKTGALKAELLKDSWNTVLRKTPSGNYKYESERDSTLIDSTIIGNNQESGTFNFTPPEFGSYRVTLTDPSGGASTQIQFYASGWGFSPWALKNPARIELDLEKKEYMPGETATLQVRAPFSGELLVTVERHNVYYTQTHTMDGNTASIPIPVNEQYRPNAYVTATLIRSVRDLEPGSAGRAFGAIPINVDRSANKLDIEITASEEIRPLNPLSIAVKTAPEATVTIAAVDEGILQLIDQKTADPFTFFYKKLALIVKSYDTFSLLLPDVALGKSQPGGGFAAKRELQFLSTQGIRRVKPIAFWSGVLETDNEGSAKVEFDIPEFQGALRIMATAIKGKQFGSSDSYTRVKSPIVILPTVPRFISLNDKVVLPVSVRNDTESDGTINEKLLSEGPVTVSKYEIVDSGNDNSTQSSKAELNVDIPRGGEKTVYFELDTSDTTGGVQLIFQASGNSESSQVSIDVPILADLPKSTSESVGRISSAETVFTLETKDNYRPGTVSRELSISKLPLIQFSGKLQFLLGYPFGCLEQTTSKVFPLIYMSEIAMELDPEIFKDSDPEAMVQDGIRRISGMQVSGGGFSLWPGSQDIDPWASIYASHFLVEAKRAGFYIQDSVSSGAVRFLKNETRAKQSYGTGELERVVYALYVLSRDGKADLSTMDFIKERHLDDLNAESRAFLAGAFASQGDTGAFEDLLQGIKDVEQVERQTGGNFNSTIRNRAILLLAILEVNPDDPRVPELVDRLSRDAEINQFWTTQESSFALLAIGEFIKKQSQTSTYSGKVYLGDKEIGSFSSATMLTLPGIQGDEPIKITMEQGYQNGSAFFSLITRGNPTRKGFKPVADGLQVERIFLTRDGAPINLDQIQQGDLIVLQTKIQSEAGRLDNVVIQNLLPSGFEVENPRLKTTETLDWITGNSIEPEYLDIRDDRILVFTNIPDAKWYNYYS